MEKPSLDAAFDSFEERWSPRVAAELNGQAMKLAKVEGAFVRHSHADADELFLVRSANRPSSSARSRTSTSVRAN